MSKMKYRRSLALLAILFFVSTVSATTKRPNDVGADKIKSTLQRPDNKRTTSSTIDSQLVQPLTTPTSRLEDGEQQLGADLAEAASSAPISEAPQVASVRQVWTASSSGSLDELSPEIIGRLRNDVPFLAAYALRPRLVGAQTASPASTSELPSGQLQPPSTATSGRLQTGASSPGPSLVPKLGDFSEFNVETSSLSKSEHHHRRKTSLKRKPKSLDDPREANLGLRRRLLATTSKMVKSRQMRNKPTKAKGRRARSDKLRGRKRARGARQVAGKSNRKRLGALMKSQARTSRLRERLVSGNLKHHMNIIKHGRYYQEQSISPSASGEMDVDTRAVGDQTTSMIVGDKNEPTGTKQLDSGVKGGKSDPNKRPFYAPGKAADADRSSAAEGTADGSVENSLDGQEQPDTGENEMDDADEADLAQPRRVGDDDVEEDGDTIMVEPKSDGVDDDPEIPEGDDSDDEDGSPIEDKTKAEREGIDDDIASDEPRGRRMHRERPNGDRDGSSSTAGGGGIGATIGGSGATDESDGSGESGGSSGSNGSDDSGGSANPEGFGGSSGSDGSERGTSDSGGSRGVGSRDDGNNDDASARDDRAEPDNFGERKSPANKNAMSGVEFADDQTGDDESDERKSGGSGESKGAAGASGSSGSKGKDANGDDDDDDTATSAGPSGSAGASMGTKGVGRDRGKASEGDGDGGDVDYADEMSIVAERGHGNRTDAGKHGGKHNGDCDDGSYEHHDDHHHGHHSHHDSIKWLQDAIPGEPGEDYPILGRVNGSNFNCRDHKYPGYYADVQSRCQIFHICQADGRQDSFL